LLFFFLCYLVTHKKNPFTYTGKGVFKLCFIQIILHGYKSFHIDGATTDIADTNSIIRFHFVTNFAGKDYWPSRD